MNNKEKKQKPTSITLLPSTRLVINRICQKENKSVSSVIENVLRKEFKKEIRDLK